MRVGELKLGRGLLAGLIGGCLAYAVPWLLLYLIVLVKWLVYDLSAWERQYEVATMSADAWLGSIFVTAIFGTAACVSFAMNPTLPVGRVSAAIGCVACFALTLMAIFEGPRYKSEPPFGEKPGDVVWLTAPAVAAGALILVWRTLKANPGNPVAADGGEPRRQGEAGGEHA